MKIEGKRLLISNFVNKEISQSLEVRDYEKFSLKKAGKTYNRNKKHSASYPNPRML